MILVLFITLVTLYMLGVAGNAALVVALHRFRHEYIAKRIVFLPLVLALQELVILINVVSRVATGYVPPFNSWLYTLTLSAALLPTATSIYLTGVFLGLWNGIGKPPDIDK